jgi:16S rRNA (uracil1498-N3)-methyltransferase
LTSNRFFIDTKKLLTTCAVLEGEEHHHLKNVARIKPGEEVWLFDGSGESYMARVDKIEKSRTRLSILDKEEKAEPRVKVTLAQALIKIKNFELIIQKATELGAYEFLPVIAARSVIKIDHKLDNKTARWSKIARESAKQSGVTRVPAIMQPKTLKDVVRERRDDTKLFLSELGGMPLRHLLVPETTKRYLDQYPSTLLILVGPEGGWTEAEEEDIVSHGFEAISLGRQILRTETAAISSLALIDHFWNQ